MELIQERSICLFWPHSMSQSSIWNLGRDGKLGPAYRRKGRDIVTYREVAAVEQALGQLTDDMRVEGHALYNATYARYREPIINLDKEHLVEVPPKNFDPNFIRGL